MSEEENNALEFNQRLHYNESNKRNNSTNSYLRNVVKIKLMTKRKIVVQFVKM